MRGLHFHCSVILLLSVHFGSVAAANKYAIFKSTNRGQSWMASDRGMPQGSRINAFSILEGSLFAGTDSGIYISRDEALSWQAAPGAIASSDRILSLAASGQTVFAGTDGGGILISSDQGQSWIRSPAFPVKKVLCLLVFQGTVYAGTDADGVFASVDEGKIWSGISQGLPARSQVSALAAVDGRLFAGLYQNGLQVLNEKERSWTKINGAFPLALAGANGALIAGHNPGGLHRSGDLGATWTRGMPDPKDSLAIGLDGGFAELSLEAPVWALAARGDLLFAGASSGIFYSEDRGGTWTRARTGLPEKSPGVSFLLTKEFVLAGTQIEGHKTR